MYYDYINKKEIYTKYGDNVMNTGDIGVQIALFTFRIIHLSKHLKKNIKDFNAKRILVKIVSKRRKLLKYVEKHDINKYSYIINELSIRK
jgi:small subunit ribosomal protein S15